MPATRAEERRRHRRLPYRRDVQVAVLATGWLSTGKLEDVSISGCYISIQTPPEQGTRIQLRFAMEKEEFEALAVVRYARPGLGMGVEFTPLDGKKRVRLERFLEARRPGARRTPRGQAELPFDTGEHRKK